MALYADLCVCSGNIDKLSNLHQQSNLKLIINKVSNLNHTLARGYSL
jgi:hypothetical protein